MSSIFEFNSDFLKFHEFIKIASWQKVFSIFSIHSINIINTICSIASFYSVTLEVFENEEVSNENLNFEKNKETQHLVDIMNSSNILKAINEATLLGNWIMLIFYEFPQHLWEIIDRLLEALRAENKITNSFRLIFDLQNTKKFTIPLNFLSDQTIIYYIHEENLDEMEGFNDVWTNILNDRILPTGVALSEKETINDYLKSMLSESKKFTLNNDISNISLEWNNIETEQESVIETVNAFQPH